MDGYRNGNVGYYQNMNQNQNQNPNNKNRNRKNKKNKNNNNNNNNNNINNHINNGNNMPLSPSKNSINSYDYSNSHSLDHQSFSNNRNNYNNNYSKFNSFNNGNNNQNQNQRKFKYNNKRRNGSQSNFGYENYDRLNKSLTPNNSFGENSKIQTSISLDNFDIVNALNSQKRSPISNSYSFMSSNIVIKNQTSPYKNSFNQQTTIIEQVQLEDEVLESTTNTKTDILSSITSTESLTTSEGFCPDDTPLSCYSTPLNHTADSSKLVDPEQSPRKHKEHEETVHLNDETPVKYDDSIDSAENTTTVKINEDIKNDVTSSTTASSNSSPDSKNSESQVLVTASEGESSFGVESNIENKITHVNIANEIEELANKFDMKVIRENEISETSTTEIESNKSVDGSVEASSTSSALSSEIANTVEDQKVDEIDLTKKQDEINAEELIEEDDREVSWEEELKTSIIQTETVVEEQNNENVEPEHKIQIRPKLDEVDLNDDLNKQTENEQQLETDFVICEKEDNLNIVSVLDEDKQTATINPTSETVVFNNSDLKTNDELNQTVEIAKKETAKNGSPQKEPPVDCFSCTIA